MPEPIMQEISFERSWNFPIIINNACLKNVHKERKILNGIMMQLK
jgi:hypothetical protein